MDVKKKKKADVFNSRGMYLNLGLVVALVFVITAFQWKSYDEVVIWDPYPKDYVDEPPMPITDIPQPPKPPKEIKIIEVVDTKKLPENKIIIESIIEPTTSIPDPPVILIEPDDEECYDCTFTGIVEEMPTADGFYNYVSKNMKYPSQARRMGIEGKVFVQFVVSKTGELTEIKVVKGIGAGCDEEAVRVIQNSPRWNPGKQRGRPVNVRMVIPIFFRLSR